MKLTINTNQVKCWFLFRRGENGVTGENLSVQSREPTNSTCTYDTGSGNRTQATSVGSEFSAPSLCHPCILVCKINRVYRGLQGAQG